MVNCLLATYTTDDVIAKVEAEVTNFRQSKHTSAVRYSDVLCDKALRCSLFYDEARLKTFIETLRESVIFEMRTLWRHIEMRRPRV